MVKEVTPVQFNVAVAPPVAGCVLVTKLLLPPVGVKVSVSKKTSRGSKCCKLTISTAAEKLTVIDCDKSPVEV